MGGTKESPKGTRGFLAKLSLKLALSHLHLAGISISQPEPGLPGRWHRQWQEQGHECKFQLHSLVTDFIPPSLSVPIGEVGSLSGTQRGGLS